MYNNTKNTRIGHNPIKFNCGYHPKILFKDDVNSRLRSCFAIKLAKKMKKLIKICC